MNKPECVNSYFLNRLRSIAHNLRLSSIDETDEERKHQLTMDAIVIKKAYDLLLDVFSVSIAWTEADKEPEYFTRRFWSGRKIDLLDIDDPGLRSAGERPSGS